MRSLRAVARAQLIDSIRQAAFLLGGSRRDWDPLLEMAQGVRFVLLGEATHGSQELYRERARITQRLVAEQGFNGVVLEADWPDADRANLWAQGRPGDDSASEALGGFRRFPTWMWRNTAVVEFLSWLRAHNQGRRAPAVLHGMDLYSLYASMDAVVDYLARHDPEAAARARARYACFEMPDRADGEEYGRALRFGSMDPCEEEAVQQLIELRERAAGARDPDLFSAEQNARLARNAEAYYRALFGSRISTWNLRDRHMHETVEAISAWLSRRDGYARLVIWAHNSHLGDARATSMGEESQLNVGQLMRERHGREALLVGFTTYEGTVTAAGDWGGPAEAMTVLPALPGSVEDLFHDVALPRFFLPLVGAGEALGELREPMLERAIGVVYRPRTERQSPYLEARLAAQFDAVAHVDRTRAVEPLEKAQLSTAEPPETCPTAL
ncbi:MAG TPA: erythromycin esterase family protein [Myxococcales bacterium]|nr:erythromycin esterase family protein [Myxococcales bacterium]